MPTKKDKDDSKVKSALLICTTLIAFASLILNFVQYQSNKQIQIFDQLSKYPHISTFRLRLSKTNIEMIYKLAEEGVKFSYIPNPSFLLYNKVSSINDASTLIQFLVIINTSDIPITSLILTQTDANSSELTNSILPPGSSLLIPEEAFTPGQAAEPITKINRINYDFSIGGNKLHDSLLVPPPSEEVVILEVGVGPISKLNIDFEEK